MVRIAIIDDGINSKILLPKCKIHHYYVSKDYQILQTRSNLHSLSHGTICGGVIISNTCVEHEIISIKVKRTDQNGNIEKLCAALKFCLKNNIDVVNISLGTRNTDDAKILYNIVIKMEKKNIIVVSAMDNNPMERAFPACFDNVIGVKHSMKAYKGIYWVNNNTVSANGIQTIELATAELYTTYACNSYATPYVTSQVANLISANQDRAFKTIMDKLNEFSVNHRRR